MKPTTLFRILLLLIVVTGACSKKPTKSLHQAVKEGDVEQVRLCIKAGVEINARDDQGYTLLHWALLLNREDVARLLIRAGANVNAKDLYGNVPLHLVRTRALTELLVDGGLDLKGKTEVGGETPLHYFAGSGKMEPAKVLILRGADINAKDNYGETPLHNAAKAAALNSVQLVDLLIAHGANVSAKDRMGDTPLHAGADVHMKPDWGGRLVQTGDGKVRQRYSRPYYRTADKAICLRKRTAGG